MASGCERLTAYPEATVPNLGAASPTPSCARPFTALPPGKRAWVNTQAFRHFFLREALNLSSLYQLLGRCLRFRKGVVPEESDNGRPMWEDRRGCVVFPIPDAALRDAEPLGDIALQQLKIKSPLPDVIA
jgi:hypothetical protein